MAGREEGILFTPWVAIPPTSQQKYKPRERGWREKVAGVGVGGVKESGGRFNEREREGGREGEGGRKREREREL